MVRLPQVGGDNGNWGDILNEYLSQAHETTGTLKPNTVGSSQLQDGSIPAGKLTSATQAALVKAESSVQSVNAKFPTSGNVTLTADDVAAIPVTQKGQAGGVAELDGDGKLTTAQVPDSVVSGNSLTGAADGQMPTWDEVAGEWKPGAPVVAGSSSGAAGAGSPVAVRIRRQLRLNASYNQFLAEEYGAWWRTNVDTLVGFHPSTIGTFQVPEYFGNEDIREQQVVIYCNAADGPVSAPMVDTDGEPLWIPYPHGTGPVAGGATFTIKARLTAGQTVQARVIMPDGTTVYGSTVGCVEDNTSGGQSDYAATLVAPPVSQLGVDQEGGVTVQWRVSGSTVADRIVAVTASGDPSRRAQDIRDPAYRAAWIDNVLNEVLTMNSANGRTAMGIWIDDANVDPGRFARRKDPTLTDTFLQPPLMDMDWWHKAMASFLAEITQAVKAVRPDCAIIHNSPWYALAPWRWDDPTRIWHKAIAAADAVNIEYGAVDAGTNDAIAINPVPADGGVDYRMYSLRSMLEYVDEVHKLGTAVHWEGIGAESVGDAAIVRYHVAVALLTWEDGDHVNITGYQPPDVLNEVFRLEPGRPLGPRYDQYANDPVNRGYIERQFENMTVRVYPHPAYTAITDANVEITPVVSPVTAAEPWALLDDFEGAAADFSTLPGWTAISGTLTRNGSGIAIPSTDSYASAVRNDQVISRDAEVWAGLGDRNGLMRLLARQVGDSYVFLVYNGYIGWAAICEVVNGSQVAAVDVAGNLWLDGGDKIGLRVDGDAAEVWVDTGAGWTQTGDAYTIAHVHAPGAIGMALGGTGITATDFGGRTITPRPAGLRGVEHDVQQLAAQVAALKAVVDGLT